MPNNNNNNSNKSKITLQSEYADFDFSLFDFIFVFIFLGFLDYFRFFSEFLIPFKKAKSSKSISKRHIYMYICGMCMTVQYMSFLVQIGILKENLFRLSVDK